MTQRLEQAVPGAQFGESDVRTAVTLLANHGLTRPLKFGELVLRQPELLNGYAGAIIRAARAHTDVYLVIRQSDETSGGQTIRWMNVTRYLKNRKDKRSRQILFDGDKLDMEAVWKVRDEFFPPRGPKAEVSRLQFPSSKLKAQSSKKAPFRKLQGRLSRGEAHAYCARANP